MKPYLPGIPICKKKQVKFEKASRLQTKNKQPAQMQDSVSKHLKKTHLFFFAYILALQKVQKIRDFLQESILTRVFLSPVANTRFLQKKHIYSAELFCLSRSPLFAWVSNIIWMQTTGVRFFCTTFHVLFVCFGDNAKDNCSGCVPGTVSIGIGLPELQQHGGMESGRSRAECTTWQCRHLPHRPDTNGTSSGVTKQTKIGPGIYHQTGTTKTRRGVSFGPTHAVCFFWLFVAYDLQRCVFSVQRKKEHP